MSAWWSEFFDEDYPLLYGLVLTPERTENELAAALRLLQLPAGARVLDSCCGEGRHALPLASRGLRICGVDQSASLLQRARRAAARDPGPARRGPGEAPREADRQQADHAALAQRPQTAPGELHLVRADARALPLEPAFDAALLLFNSIGYGSDEDTLAMLREARRVLAPGGQLLLDCVHRDEQVRRAQPGRTREWLDNRGVRIFTERWIDPLAGTAHAIFRFTRGEEEIVKTFRHRLYTASEVLELVLRAGFSRVDCYGGYDLRPFGLDAPLLVVHGRA